MPLSIHPPVLPVALRLALFANAAVLLFTSAKRQVALWSTEHSLARRLRFLFLMRMVCGGVVDASPETEQVMICPGSMRRCARRLAAPGSPGATGG